jgi:hypothetical protein
MAHWAELDEDNKVLRVVVTSNDDSDEGYSWLQNNLGGTWVQTSYNAKIRKNFAGIGFSYEQDLDAFIPPKPFDSWLLDEATGQWQPPTPKPEGNYFWNEGSLSWLQVEEV